MLLKQKTKQQAQRKGGKRLYDFNGQKIFKFDARFFEITDLLGENGYAAECNDECGEGNGQHSRILRQQFAAVRRLDEPLRKGGGELSALVEGR